MDNICSEENTNEPVQELQSLFPDENIAKANVKKTKKPINIKKLITYLVILVAIPLVIVVGIVLFKDRQYNVISMGIALLSLIPFFLAFEKRTANIKEIVVIAVMIAISVVGRLIFYPVPGFKPVTAIVIIAAISLGSEAGFLTGAMSALVSDMFFGQGPWTPFQMFTWGILGFIFGFIAKSGVMKYKVSQIIAAIVSGVAFSLIMDIWTALNMDGTFNIYRYLTYIVSSLPFMAIYAASNTVFILVLYPSINKKLERIKKKYKIFM